MILWQNTFWFILAILLSLCQFLSISELMYGDLYCFQQGLVSRGICSEAEATDIVNKKCVPVVGEQQRKFEKMLESFDVSAQQSFHFTLHQMH